MKAFETKLDLSAMDSSKVSPPLSCLNIIKRNRDKKEKTLWEV